MAFYDLKNIVYTIQSKHHPSKRLFDHLSLALNQNELVTLSGENGVGKTTLTKIMLGVNAIDSGQVLLEGRSIYEYELHEVGRRIGYLFQNPSIQLFNRSIKEELYFAYEYGVEIKGDIKKRYQQTIETLGLEKALSTPVVQLSQGEKQRVAIATILMNDPEFIILDEPTVGLDQKRMDILLDILIKLNEQNIGLMIISHNRNFIARLPARHLVLEKGGNIYEPI